MPVCFGGFAIGGLIIIKLFSASLISVVPFLKIIVWSIIFVSVSSALGAYLISWQAKNDLLNAAAFTVAIGFLASLVLIKFFGIYGTVYSVLLMELTAMTNLIYFVKRYVRPELGVLNFSKSCLRVDGDGRLLCPSRLSCGHYRQRCLIEKTKWHQIYCFRDKASLRRKKVVNTVNAELCGFYNPQDT